MPAGNCTFGFFASSIPLKEIGVSGLDVKIGIGA
jgi:hypothetical protein